MPSLTFGYINRQYSVSFYGKLIHLYVTLKYRVNEFNCRGKTVVTSMPYLTMISCLLSPATMQMYRYFSYYIFSAGVTQLHERQYTYISIPKLYTFLTHTHTLPCTDAVIFQNVTPVSYNNLLRKLVYLSWFVH